MLSGSLARGNSSTPTSGKIGSTSGRTGGCARPPTKSRSCGSLIRRRPSWPVASWPSASRPPDLQGQPGSREHQRRQPPPRAQGQRIGRPHRLEEFDELLARRLLVPLAVAPEQGQQLVDCLLPLAGAEQSGRQLEARLVVVRVLLDAGAQLGGGAHRLLPLLGEVERRTRRGNLRVARDVLRRTVEHLPGLIEF